MEEVTLDALRPDQIVRVGTSLPMPLKEEMIDLLVEHRDVFA